MKWQDFGTGRCCTDGCRHKAPDELSTDIQRFGAIHFHLVASLMERGASTAEAVAVVNIMINRGDRPTGTWREG